VRSILILNLVIRNYLIINLVRAAIIRGRSARKVKQCLFSNTQAAKGEAAAVNRSTQ
jgi:hypothetical protein